jgi:uncharacterized RmlC-like cupin family protein
MKIISPKEGIFKKKEDGTEVIYHIFPEFEIHQNEIPSKTTQVWHHHKIIEEVICILSGEIEIHWKENNKSFSQIVKKGDIIRVEDTPHTFINSSNEKCIFIVFRFVPSGTDKREIIKNDKYLD